VLVQRFLRLVMRRLEVENDIPQGAGKSLGSHDAHSGAPAEALAAEVVAVSMSWYAATRTSVVSVI
jgi:hypothetical protein